MRASLDTCQPHAQNRTLVRLPDGRPVGSHDGHTFYRVLKPQHFTEVPPGIAVDVVVLDSLTAAGVTWCHFTAAADGTSYMVPLDVFRRRGLPIQRGHGQQLLLPLADFFTVAVGQLVLPLDAFVGGAE